MALPITLYKFRDWDNSYHRRLLSNNELYFANNKDFNDPFDTNLPFVYNNKINKECLKKELWNREGIELSDKELDNMVSEFQKNPDHLNNIIKESADNNNMQRDYENHLGIFCASTDNSNPLMWGHYANSHKGFCVGLDFQKINNFISEKYKNGKSIIKHVKYDTIMPTMNPLGVPKIKEYAWDRITTKSIHWNYENEYRIIIANRNKQAEQIPAEIYKEVIFGLKMDPVSEFEIRAICKERFPNIKFYKAKINNKEFKVDIELYE